MKINFTIILSLYLAIAWTQSRQIEVNFDWTTTEVKDYYSQEDITLHTFSKGYASADHPEIAGYSNTSEISYPAEVSVNVIIEETSPILIKGSKTKDLISSRIKPWSKILETRGQYSLQIGFLPVIQTASGYEKVEKARISYQIGAPIARKRTGPTFTTQSSLGDGTLYKIKISQTGIHRIDKNYLRDAGFDVDNLDPRNISVLTHHSRSLAEALSDERIDDWNTTAIMAKGDQDGRLDDGDYFLFYAEGPNAAYVQDNKVKIEKNIYDKDVYAIIKLGNSAAPRISDSNQPNNAEYSTNQYQSYQRYEEDKINLLGQFPATQGTGQLWFGDRFNADREFNYTSKFDFQDINTSAPITANIGFAARCNKSSQVYLDINEATISESLRATNVTSQPATSVYAHYEEWSDNMIVNSDNVNVVLRYPYQGTGANGESEGWLDYLELVINKNLIYKGNPLYFSQTETSDHETCAFNMSGQPQHIWNITNTASPQKYNRVDGDIRFYSQGMLQLFVAFDENDAITPAKGQKLENQNIHELNRADLLVLYHPDFAEGIDRYVQHRKSTSQIEVQAYDITKVYNEFSGGKCDPTAIRDLAKMIHDRDDQFRYLLLIGDGSYDYRAITPGIGDQNFIPVYETKESLHPINGFPADDYYSLLDDSEGGNLVGQVDIAVGRMPVKSLAEYNAVLNKLIHYESNTASLGDWRMKIAFASDDEDGNRHLDDTEKIANNSATQYPRFNQSKIYFDAYEQESTPGGARYPDASKEINRVINRGVLAFNYLGHGSPKGWAQERVLQISDIQSWSNFDKLTLLITATCTFTGYDEPTVVSGGEEAFLNPKGGAIALLSTTRAVFARSNERLVSNTYSTLFELENGKRRALGDVIRNAKNANGVDTLNVNARKFTLIGDPSLKLSYPVLNIQTSEINGVPIAEFQDTLKALEKVTIKGFVSDANGNIISDYNGIVRPLIYDKSSKLSTLSNDSSSPKKDYSLFKNIIFKGAATVSNGQFEYSFVVPKDIDYKYGSGRISYYASNETLQDAGGYTKDVTIGGTSSNSINDNEGPIIDLYMNDESFTFGGNTDREPTLIVKLEDENGINVTGTSIGHDLTGKLESDSQKEFIMNDYYEATVDDYRKGVARYPLSGLEPGRHTIKVKAWDVLNNKSEAKIEFVVIDDSNEGLTHVYNFPNPFTTKTKFMFEHNIGTTELDVLVDIYTVSGKLIKTIETTTISNSNRVDDIAWDGKDDFGESIGKGVYLYKIKARSQDLNVTKESDFQKLVILK